MIGAGFPLSSPENPGEPSPQSYVHERPQFGLLTITRPPSTDWFTGATNSSGTTCCKFALRSVQMTSIVSVTTVAFPVQSSAVIVICGADRVPSYACEKLKKTSSPPNVNDSTALPSPQSIVPALPSVQQSSKAKNEIVTFSPGTILFGAITPPSVNSEIVGPTSATVSSYEQLATPFSVSKLIVYVPSPSGPCPTESVRTTGTGPQPPCAAASGILLLGHTVIGSGQKISGSLSVHALKVPALITTALSYSVSFKSQITSLTSYDSPATSS
mmetsp:Transcript_10960/g.23435  ORF Transcript_10960/g.23435 Transcript_10960/m.23435 type:complete len:272 (-) Transcript_10960:168-983(-)